MVARKLSQSDLDRVEGMSSREAAALLGVGKSTVNDARRMQTLKPLAFDQVQESSNEPRILALDIETAPNLAYVWGLWDQNVSIKQLVSSTQMLCWGARWLDEDNVAFRSVHHNGQQSMVQGMWDLVNEADAIMGWNSASFDVKHLNREFLESGLGPTSPWRDMDLMRDVKRAFKFPSNKLDYVAQRLGVGAKFEHSGFELWIKCMAGDEAAWEEMRTYQIQDVDLLIDLYYKLRPWLKSHPAQGLFTGDQFGCPTCGSHDLDAQGFYRTNVSMFNRFVCKACGRWSYDPHRVGFTKIRGL